MGGAHRVCFNTATLLENNGHEVVFFSTEEDKRVPTSYKKYFTSRIDFTNLKFVDKLKVFLLFVYNKNVYIAAFKIAIDHFPFGSGPGTFGSFPVKVVYNDLYFDYNLYNVWGLHDVRFNRYDPSFLLDTYWASILGELGFLGFIVFLIIYFYPVLLIKKMLNIRKELIVKVFSFYIISVSITIFTESIVLSIFSQISIIILYCGIAGIMIRFIKDNKKKNLKILIK